MASDPLPTETKYIVPALAQGLGILSLFSGAQRSFTAPEIAKKLSLPRTKVFRLLQTLLSMDYLRCEEDKRHFSLGPALLSRGFEYLASLDMVEVAQPILQRARFLVRVRSPRPTAISMTPPPVPHPTATTSQGVCGPSSGDATDATKAQQAGR